MNTSKVGLRYAKAVLQQATDDKNVKEVFADMTNIQDTLAGSKELRTSLQSPVIKASDKQAILSELFSNSTKTTQNLIQVLVANRRTHFVGDVAGGYIALYNQAQGVKEVTVTTAAPMDSALEAKVLAKAKTITGSDNISLENQVNPDIIGGFILRVGDLQYNASIASQLGKLRKEFSNSI